jgi:hypothetical protein
MGYTTDFEGEFHCYHPENKELASFLEDVRTGDRNTIAPLADWLADRSDPRGPQIASMLPQLGDDLTPFWRLFGFTPEHAAYLRLFNETRRMRRDPEKAKLLPDPVRNAAGLTLGPEAGYFVGGEGYHGQEDADSVLDHNRPPSGQPGLWCNWTPNEHGTAILWDGGEKFYSYLDWMEYLLQHFLIPWGYVLNGEVHWAGEEEEDRGIITIRHNQVEAEAES